jgi:hypothetical protein
MVRQPPTGCGFNFIG